MKSPNALQPEFDEYAGDYEAALQKGLSLSGEDKHYFANARIRWLVGRLAHLQYLPKSVLDFGCGTGTSVPLLLDLPGVESVTGVEVSQRSIDVARARYPSDRIRFALTDAIEQTQSFDLVFCNGVFHHIPPAARAVSVQYVFDRMQFGGLFAFWENNPWNPGTRLIMNRIPFDRDAITLSPFEARTLLARAGFEILKTDYLFFFPRVLARFRRLEPYLAWLPLGGQYLVLCRKPKSRLQV